MSGFCEYSDWRDVGYTTKKQLYDWIADRKEMLGCEPDAYPINAFHVASMFAPRLEIEARAFHTKGLCGILVHGPRKSKISLNNRRVPDERNFDCLHELIHFWRHPLGEHVCFTSEYRALERNHVYEWQANEGAAEALIPHKVFIPYCVNLINQARIGIVQADGQELIQIMMQNFEVSRCNIQYRLKTLSYEIHQYMNGTPIDDIEILSNAQQKQRGITCPCAYELVLSIPRAPEKYVPKEIFLLPPSTNWEYVISTGKLPYGM